jgi:hypothetical protein
MADEIDNDIADEAVADEPKRKIGFGIATILVVATIVTLLAFLSLWANRQILDTDQWTETSTALLEKPAVRDALANYLVDQLFTNVDVQGELEADLPPAIAGLAGPITGGLRQLALKGAETALEKPAVQAAWKDANRVAHEHLIKILEGGSDEISTANGVVTVDTRALLTNVAEQVGVPTALVAKLPPSVGELEVLQSDQLKTSQNAYKAVKGMMWIFTILALILYTAAIWLGAGRRRRVVRWVGISFASVGLLILLIHALARGPVIDGLSSTSAVVPAVADIYDTTTVLLHDMAVSAFVAGLLVILASVLAGPSKFAVGFRREVAPYMNNYLPAAAAFATLLFLLLVWWAPTHGFRTTGGLVLNLILAVAGFAALARITRHEFPDAEAPDFGSIGDWSREHWHKTEDWARGLSWNREHTADAPTVEVKTTTEEDSLAEIERLQSLRERGALTDEEFAEQKRKLLGD